MTVADSPRVNGALLRWARETCGMTIDQVAEKIEAPGNMLAEWEGTHPVMPLTTVEELGLLFRRPIACFFLSKPPKDPPPPSDMRLLPQSKSAYSREILFVFRRCRRMQHTARLLSDEGNLSPRVPHLPLSSNAEEGALKVRATLGITFERQKQFKSSDEALKTWRRAVESNNILTFQMPFPKEDASGFSLADATPSVIVSNSHDVPNRRIFTLFHELGHICLHGDAVCFPGKHRDLKFRRAPIERWCDHFAGALLLPQEALDSDARFQQIVDANPASIRTLGQLSKTWSVSRYAIITRLLTLGRLDEDTYKAVEKVVGGEPIRKGGGVIPYPAKIIAQRGVRYVATVVSAMEKGVITHAQAADYLSVRIPHLDQIPAFLG